MAATVKELKEWLDGLPDNKLVAIDDGGLALVIQEPGKDCSAWPYFEMGGIRDLDLCDRCGEPNEDHDDGECPLRLVQSWERGE